MVGSETCHFVCSYYFFSHVLCLASFSSTIPDVSHYSHHISLYVSLRFSPQCSLFSIYVSIRLSPQYFRCVPSLPLPNRSLSSQHVPNMFSVIYSNGFPLSTSFSFFLPCLSDAWNIPFILQPNTLLRLCLLSPLCLCERRLWQL